MQKLDILYLTDLYYKAQGRNYYEEDLYITSQLKDYFNILIGHPQQAIDHIDKADLIVFRNTGPVVYYQEYFDHFVNSIQVKNKLTFNSFDGKADMKGKQYLLDLYAQNYPVIPTVEKIEDLDRLPESDQYIIKLKNGADSIGMQSLRKEEIANENLNGKIIQPYIDFEYELSFYFINNEFQYALYAPDKHKRWELMPYEPQSLELDFASKFIEWNNMKCGIQRVDACKLKDGSLLLVELEDLNPYLSIDLLTEDKKHFFIDNFVKALSALKA
ncbi:hypothetical protein [Marivirga arenosa]|uniref:ATP-grasp domain-containing protein n=1 Tax=Marivirga arenosa TaxID=3059076 RepID=A0AA49GEA3_9BACT|nr:hypothetical protein [Marivirga sp. BKB1-2]WKK81444.1 hypothetical protein QYS47_03800 [Marivirga sp. BKB1-2]